MQNFFRLLGVLRHKLPRKKAPVMPSPASQKPCSACVRSQITPYHLRYGGFQNFALATALLQPLQMNRSNRLSDLPDFKSLSDCRAKRFPFIGVTPGRDYTPTSFGDWVVPAYAHFAY